MGMIAKVKRIAKKLPWSQGTKRLVLKAKEGSYRKALRQYQQPSPGILKNLIIMDAGIGNAVEATPFVQAIRALRPRDQITLVAGRGDLFDGWCVVDEVVASLESLSGRTYDHTYVTLASELGQVELREPLTLGQIHRVEHDIGQLMRPEREYNLELARSEGFTGDTPPLYVSMKRPDVIVPESEYLIALVPGSKPIHRWRHKLWPHFSELAAQLLNQYEEVTLAIIGTQDDQFIAPVSHRDRILDLRGQLSLAETAWVLRQCDLAIGNDCGPMHIADAVRTISLIIFGPTCELKNGPVNTGVAVVSDIHCRPCQYSDLLLTCPEAKCMIEISVGSLLERVSHML